MYACMNILYHVYIHTYIYIYIHMYRERERDVYVCTPLGSLGSSAVPPQRRAAPRRFWSRSPPGRRSVCLSVDLIYLSIYPTLSLSLSLSVCIYIYIYIERERERLYIYIYIFEREKERYRDADIYRRIYIIDRHIDV